MPTAGFSAASAIPRAAATPTRNPVKLPGPVVTATRSMPLKAVTASAITRSTSGISASAWPRVICKLWLAKMRFASLSKTATEQAAKAVSIASTRTSD